MIHGRFTEVVVSLTHATIFYSAATLAIQRSTKGFEKQTHKKGVLEDLGPEEPPETANCLVPGHCFKGRRNDVC